MSLGEGGERVKRFLQRTCPERTPLRGTLPSEARQHWTSGGSCLSQLAGLLQTGLGHFAQTCTRLDRPWFYSGSQGFPSGQVANAGDARGGGLIPGSRRSPGKGNGNPPQYSCLQNSMDSGAWRATVPGFAKN